MKGINEESCKLIAALLPPIITVSNEVKLIILMP